ncbi:unnamed protein product [Microthlaspi erraticum]|uniref:Ubiquitin-like domain-containing protein n=1 Tax=Microthlaspi erraticum TaxID=1685480 RepID=A0A6D2KC76_9BRAS|nr:unnamed protein product [Microthlaspi erraticum]
MVVIVANKSGSTFSIDADTKETVSGVKRKIEMSQGIPIVKKSRLHLFVPHNDQVLHQTEQSPVPSKSSTEISNIEDSTLIARSDNDGDQVLNQTVEPPLTSDEMDEILSWPLLTAEDCRNVQETWRRSSNNQDLLQRETSPPSNLNGEFAYGDDRPLSAEEIRILQEDVNVQDLLQGEPSPPSNLVRDHFMYGDDRPLLAQEIRILQGNVNVQDSSRSKTYYQDLLLWESSPPSNSTEERINTRDETVNVGSSNPPVKMIRRAPKYPRKMRVMILPCSHESKAVEKFPVYVNAFENVEELRKDLEELQERSELNLPEKGYFFILKQRVLEEDQSFWGNNVVPGDTIEIFSGSKDGRVRQPGH